LPQITYKEERAAMQPGDVLVLYSDGVTEAANPSGEDFGEDRLGALVASLRRLPASDIVESIHNAVMTFTSGPAADDITVVVARRA
jgi:sigma-B regulation protein RsbU (phosphoserine phosphatase)